MQTGFVGFQLKSLAELLQRVYAAVDLSQIARAVSFHVRDGLPPSSRSLSALQQVEKKLVVALEDLYLASLAPDKDAHTPLPISRISQAESYYQSQLDSAARILDREELVTVDGSVIRAASDAIAEAAVDVVRRRSAAFALEIARDQEKLGAPPSLLFQLDGHVVWSNHSLLEMIENRRLGRTALVQRACRFAAPICAALRRREEPDQAKMKQHLKELGIHLRAQVRRKGESAGESLLLVEVSEARRSTDLSPREIEVARLVARHGSYQSTADKLGVSLDSVRTYIRRIYRKLGVGNRTQLKVRLIREGLLPKE